MTDTHSPYPRLDDIVKANDVSQKGTGNFAADYVNWSRIAHYLREHAPGWQPFTERNAEGGLVHTAPDGTCFMLIGFSAGGGIKTEVVPHAIMDNRMNAKKNPDARDVADAYVRGMCKAAALLFGLGWKLWSKDDPMDRDDVEPQRKAPPKKQGSDTAATDAQRKAIYAISMKLGYDDAKRSALLRPYGATRSDDLTRKQASEILNNLKVEEEIAAKEEATVRQEHK